MEDEGSRQDYYMVYEYLNDLTGRNLIEELLDGMPPGRCLKLYPVPTNALQDRARDLR